MAGQVLVYVADSCDFLQVRVHLLIGDDGEQMLLSALVISILEDEPLGDVQQNNIYKCACLNTAALDPLDAVERHDILTLQIGQVDIGKAGETGEHEKVTDGAQAVSDLEVFLNDGLKLLLREVASVNILHVELDTKIRVRVENSELYAVEDDGP